MQSMSTLDSPITLSCIVEVSRLLHPVGLGPVSQGPSPGYHSDGPYRSQVLVGRYPTNSLIDRRLILWRSLSGKHRSRCHPLSGIILSFPRLFQTTGQIIDVLLSILPVPCGA